MNDNEHVITSESAGVGECGWMVLKCSCGWKSRLFYAYEDYQRTMAQEARADHLSDAKERS